MCSAANGRHNAIRGSFFSSTGTPSQLSYDIEAEFGIVVSLLGGEPIPLHGFGGVLGHAFPDFVGHTEVVLGHGRIVGGPSGGPGCSRRAAGVRNGARCVCVRATDADVIIGNPPWSSRRGVGRSSVSWCAEHRSSPGQPHAVRPGRTPSSTYGVASERVPPKTVRGIHPSRMPGPEPPPSPSCPSENARIVLPERTSRSVARPWFHSAPWRSTMRSRSYSSRTTITTVGTPWTQNTADAPKSPRAILIALACGLCPTT